MYIRKSAVSGVFYPHSAESLNENIAIMLQDAKQHQIMPKIVIAPHAGYLYSGFVAANTYKQFLNLDNTKHYNILIIGPSHRVYSKEVAFSSANCFETPLGLVNVDKTFTEQYVAKHSHAIINDEAHSLEHSIETQLPFLQTTLKDFSIVPAIYNNCKQNDILELLSIFLKQENSIAIISADLSHFMDYNSAIQCDTETIKAIEDLKPLLIDNNQTCGQLAICATLEYAKQHNLKEKTLDYKNSGDFSLDKTRVVGYMSAIFYFEAQKEV